MGSRNRSSANLFANIDHLLQLSNKIDETMRVAINRKHKHPLLLLKKNKECGLIKTVLLNVIYKVENRKRS